MQIRSIIFDVGNVLLKWCPETVLLKNGFSLSDAKTFLKEIHSIWLDFDQGLITENTLIHSISQRLMLPKDKITLIIQDAKLSLQPINGVLNLLEKLYQTNISLYCITNMSNEFYQYLKKNYTFWDKFCDVIVSARVKLLKPDIAIYQYLINKHQLNPNETIMIDDRIENIETACLIGLKGIVFTNAAQLQQQLNQLDCLR